MGTSRSAVSQFSTGSLEERRMGGLSFTLPSSASIVIRYSRLKIVKVGIGVTATFHINLFGVLPSRYGFDDTAIRADFDVGKTTTREGNEWDYVGVG